MINSDGEEVLLFLFYSLARVEYAPFLESFRRNEREVVPLPVDVSRPKRTGHLMGWACGF